MFQTQMIVSGSPILQGSQIISQGTQLHNPGPQIISHSQLLASGQILSPGTQIISQGTPSKFFINQCLILLVVTYFEEQSNLLIEWCY